MSTRAEREAQARELRDKGMLLREIAAEMGVARSTVSDYLCDPGGARLRARKDSYRGSCVDCGAATDGSNGPDGNPERCCPCAGAHIRKVTRQWILDSMSEWHEMFGVPPTAGDWNLSLAERRAADAPNYARRIIERRESTGRPWPAVSTVIDHFGSWSAGLRAAGFEPISRKDSALGYRGRALRDEDRNAA